MPTPQSKPSASTPPPTPPVQPSTPSSRPPIPTPSPASSSPQSPGAPGGDTSTPLSLPAADRGWTDKVAVYVNKVRGTRALIIGGTLLLILAAIEPALPPAMSRLFLVAPITALLVVGLLTLPAEGVVAQQRARALLVNERPMRAMWIRMAWILALCLLLLPPLFLAAYGIPHMNPLTGLLLPTIQRRMSLVFLYFVLLLPILYLRSNRRYAPQIRAGIPEPRTRDGLLVMTYGLAAGWAILLEPFWRPFSLLQWPPGIWSLDAGVRGVAAISFSIIIPVALFMSLAAHFELLRFIRRQGPDAAAKHRSIYWMAIAQILAVLLAIILHAYDLLWIVRYEAASTL